MSNAYKKQREASGPDAPQTCSMILAIAKTINWTPEMILAIAKTINRKKGRIIKSQIRQDGRI
jgi:hypothetical protein